MPFTHPLLAPLDDDTRQILQRYRFDEFEFVELARSLAAGGLTGGNRLAVDVTPPLDGDLVGMAPHGSVEARRLAAIGQQAIDAGQLAVAVLNGGMATRFGGGVKGVTDALPGRSFLQMFGDKVAGARGGGQLPLLLMNSFATAATTRLHLGSTGQLGLGPSGVRCFAQSVFPRLNEDGSLFVGEAGGVSLYGPGHGDFLDSVRAEGIVRWLRDEGVRYLALSNVDNLGAGPDPLILGHHIEAGRALTAEVVHKRPRDRGGAPARVEGHLEIVEDFRFPEGFDPDQIPVFNTNTFLFDIASLDRDYPLDWFQVTKSVEGQPVVQFERLVGQVTSFVDATYLVVPREGIESRFLPVKSPADLEALQPLLLEKFGRR